jgi:undecaprenyl-diphosphatase
VFWWFLFYGFVLLTIFTITGKTEYFDSNIMHILNSSQIPILNLFLVGFSELGLIIAVVFSPIVILWYILGRNNRKGHFIAIVMFGSILIWEAFNILFVWSRPQSSITLTQSYSYPSGHVLVGLCFYLSLAITINDSVDNRNKRIVTWAIPVIIIAIISVSRMYLRAHYPTDVIAGLVIGVLWLLAVVLYFDKIEVPLIRIETFMGRVSNFFIKTHKQYV